MSKSKSRSRRRSRPTQERRVVDVISQLECAVRRPRAAILGGLLGGAVPWFARALSHNELPEAWARGQKLLVAAMLVVVLGCMAFSMLTVHKFGRAAFQDERKAVVFVLALEGVMLVSRGATSNWALLLLVVINAVANGCVIALEREATARRQETDERRRATRAQSRLQTRGEGASSRSPTIPVVTSPGPTAVQGGHCVPTRTSSRDTVARSRWIPETVPDAEVVAYTYS